MTQNEMEAAEALLILKSGPHYFVERVVGHRMVSFGHLLRPEVLVKWQNFSQLTWEPVDGPDGLGNIDAIRQYVERIKVMRARKQ